MEKQKAKMFLINYLAVHTYIVGVVSHFMANAVHLSRKLNCLCRCDNVNMKCLKIGLCCDAFINESEKKESRS